MPKKKIMVVFGTRPEAIKMAPLILKLRDESEHFSLQVCITAQHRQMLDRVLEIFDIIPDIDLNIMKPEQDLFDITSSILIAMRDVFSQYKPHLVLVHGDTTTTLATSIAAFYSGIKIGQVEAGLRTHNFCAPFPEEFNRQVTSKITSLHFTPTELGKVNLINEGIPKSKISITGNTVIDALYLVLSRIQNDNNRLTHIENILDTALNFDWRNNIFILITGHRRENFGEGFFKICSAIRKLATKFPNIYFVYPLHLNPNVRNPVNASLSKFSNIILIEHLDYEPFVYLLKHSYLVLTDSGGIQEEAPSLGKPVLVMRNVTERPEGVEAGTIELVGANQEKIISGVSRLIEDKVLYKRMAYAHNPYGDGNACDRIINVLKKLGC